MLSNVSAFLINKSNSSIKKQMSDRIEVLAYFEYFLSCQWFCLIETKKTKVSESDLTTGFIKVTSA